MSALWILALPPLVVLTEAYQDTSQSLYGVGSFPGAFPAQQHTPTKKQLDNQPAKPDSLPSSQSVSQPASRPTVQSEAKVEPKMPATKVAEASKPGKTKSVQKNDDEHQPRDHKGNQGWCQTSVPKGIPTEHSCQKKCWGPQDDHGCMILCGSKQKLTKQGAEKDANKVMHQMKEAEAGMDKQVEQAEQDMNQMEQQMKNAFPFSDSFNLPFQMPSFKEVDPFSSFVKDLFPLSPSTGFPKDFPLGPLENQVLPDGVPEGEACKRQCWGNDDDISSGCMVVCEPKPLQQQSEAQVLHQRTQEFLANLTTSSSPVKGLYLLVGASLGLLVAFVVHVRTRPSPIAKPLLG